MGNLEAALKVLEPPTGTVLTCDALAQLHRTKDAFRAYHGEQEKPEAKPEPTLEAGCKVTRNDLSFGDVEELDVLYFDGVAAFCSDGIGRRKSEITVTEAATPEVGDLVRYDNTGTRGLIFSHQHGKPTVGDMYDVLADLEGESSDVWGREDFTIIAKGNNAGHA